MRARRVRVVFSLAGALALTLLVGGGAAATKTYSSPPLHIAIRDGATVEQAINVRDAGPVWHLTVAVRLDHARDSDLTVSLVAPDGTAARLFSHQGGTGRDLGAGQRNCGGQFTVFRDDADARLGDSGAPFVGSQRPDQRLAHLYGKQARGRWTLRIADDVPGKTGMLYCWQLDVSRNVLEVKRGASGNVRAELSYREREFTYRDVRLRIIRSGRAVFDEPVPRIGCGSCPYWQPVTEGHAVVVRDLDRDGEPEIVTDAFTGGAHCCTYSLVYRYVRDRATYVRTVVPWGNAGYRLLDLDHDGRAEFSSGDDRFAYAFTAFVASFDPVRISRFDHGRMVDVTRSFPGFVRRNANSLWATYRRIRKSAYRDVRGVLAAYMADKYLLGEQGVGWRQLDGAFRRGELGHGVSQDGYPVGRAYLTKLRAFLRRTGYAR